MAKDNNKGRDRDREKERVRTGTPMLYISLYIYIVDNSGFQAERPDFCNPTVDSSSVTTAGKGAIGNCGE